MGEKFKTPKEVKSEAIVKKMTVEANSLITKGEAILKMNADLKLDDSIPFQGVNKVTANLFLDNIYPAILSNGNLFIEVMKGMFMPYDKFQTLEGKLPIDIYVRIERFYLMDWSKFNS